MAGNHGDEAAGTARNTTVFDLPPEKNRLEIEVTDLSANRIRDLDRRGVKWRIFHNANVVSHNYRRFDASKWPVMDSGLLGPVLLRPIRERAL